MHTIQYNNTLFAFFFIQKLVQFHKIKFVQLRKNLKHFFLSVVESKTRKKIQDYHGVFHRTAENKTKVPA